MIRQWDRKDWTHQQYQINGNTMISFPDLHSRPSKHIERVKPIPIQHLKGNTRIHQRQYEEFYEEDREKAAQTGRWILHAIAQKEAYKQTKTKKHSFQSRKSSKVEPVDSSKFHHVHIKNNKNHKNNHLPHDIILSPTTIDDGQTDLSSFSSATSIDDIRTIDRSNVSTRTRSKDCSTDQFNEGEDKPCISKRVMIVFTIISIILVVGIIVGVFVTIFVGKHDSTDSSGKSINLKSMTISQLPPDGLLCPTPMFNLTDPLCNGEIPYRYYSCYQMATSTTFTIRFTLQHDTISGHWYFDDISAVQDNNTQLITNGGFESNLTGWIINTSSDSTSDTFVDRSTGLAHTGSVYLNGGSKNSSDYIEQTFNVIQGEYINVSFWWGYDEGSTVGRTCKTIGQLIPS